MKRRHLISAVLLLLLLLLFSGCQGQQRTDAITQTETAASSESATACSQAETEAIPVEAESETALEDVEATGKKSGETEEVDAPDNAKAPADSSSESRSSSCQHSFGAERTVAASCEKEGYTTHTCTLCGYTETYNRTVSIGHTWTSGETVSPTCTAKGYTQYTCTRCGAVDKFGWKAATGHKWGAWQQTSAPTCSNVGKEARRCTVCGESETRDVSKLPHTWKSSTVSPSCLEDGYTQKTCTVCGETEKTDKTPALGHDYQFTKTVAPTTSSGGYDLYTCTRCGATEHRNETDKLKQIYDVNEAMEAGNNLARSYGCTIDYSLDASNSGYYPPDDTSGGYFDRNGGQARLNALAVENVQDTIDRLLYSENYDYDQLKLYRIRCLVLYYEATDVYDIWVFYG